MTSKRVVVIGAGMAGLCTGIYLQMNGYEVRILEAHASPGGLCTSWTRQGYTFDGCIHWLLGSAPGTTMHAIWRELVDLDDVRFVDHDRILSLELDLPDALGRTRFDLWSDLDRLERYLLEAAPEDARPIRTWVRAARRFVRPDFPPDRPPPEVRTWRDSLALLPLVPVLPALNRWASTTNRAFAVRFRSPFLRRALDAIYGGHEAGMVILFMQQAWYHMRCAGYPLGGSLAFARRFERRFLDLGGTLRYGARVDRILVEDGAAVGVRLEDGSEERADVVVSAADGRWTVKEALGGRFTTPLLDDLYAGRTLDTFPSLLYVSLGVRGGLPGLGAHMVRFHLPSPWTLPDGTQVDQVPIHAYDYDPALAPEGCVAVISMLESRAIDFWERSRAEDRASYAAAKAEVAARVVDLLESRLGGVRERVEVVDVATPATFRRYTGNWKGAYEGWFPTGHLLKIPTLPRELPGLRGFHMVGQWVEPGGGLPPAALHGRGLARLLCRRDGRPFRVIPPPSAATPSVGAGA